MVVAVFVFEVLGVVICIQDAWAWFLMVDLCFAFLCEFGMSYLSDVLNALLDSL